MSTKIDAFTNAIAAHSAVTGVNSTGSLSLTGVNPKENALLTVSLKFDENDSDFVDLGVTKDDDESFRTFMKVINDKIDMAVKLEENTTTESSEVH